MWSPTHVQVLVKRAKGLKIKGKNGTDMKEISQIMDKNNSRY